MARIFACFAIYFAVALILYAPTLHSFFIFDDISLLRLGTPFGGATFHEGLMPLSNGFWRPIPLSIAWVVVALWGPVPFWTHLLPIVFHAANGALCFLIGRRLGWSDWRAFAAGLLLIIHFGAYLAVNSFQDCGDPMLATFMLAGILSLLTPISAAHRFALVGICYLLAAGCKEVAILFPSIAFAWMMATRERDGSRARILPIAALALLVMVSHAAAVCVMQRMCNSSYTSTGRVHIGAIGIIRQFVDYSMSLTMPQMHVSVMPWLPINLPDGALWAIRFLTAGGLAWLAFRSMHSHDYLTIALSYSALSCISLPSLLGGHPEGRYLYPALPFVALLLCHLGKSESRALAAGAKSLVVIIALFSAISFRASPTVTGYVKTADGVQRLMEQATALSKDWPTGSMIAIYDHPHPGEPEYRWVVCQQLFNLYLPEKRITIALDKTPPEAFAAYRFRDGALVKIPNSNVAKPSQ